MHQHLKTLCRNTLLGLLLAGPFAAANANDVEQRLERLERVFSGGTLTEMVNELEQLRREVQNLRGELELVQRELDETKHRQRDLYSDNDRRLRELEQGRQAPTQAVPVPDLDTDSEDGDNASFGGSGEEQADLAFSGDEWEDYQQAFSILRAGRYAEAGRAFSRYLETYPQGSYRDNAVYWLGESHYVVREFDTAHSYFERIVTSMPDSNKRADALLKIGFIHFELDDMVQAQEALEQLKREFPDSTAASLAEQRLSRIRARR